MNNIKMSQHNFYDIEMMDVFNGIFEEIDTLKETINKAQEHLNSDLKATLQRQLKYHWTYHSNALEGNTLTLGDTIFFLEQGLTVQGKPLKDFLEAKNHSEALDYFYDILNTQGLSPYRMKEINRLLLSGISHTAAVHEEGQPNHKQARPGQYKQWPNPMIQLDGTIHQYVEPVQVASEMESLFEWIDAVWDIRHPIITAAVAHYNMVRIHPFDDGNGRGARILMNLILMKKYYPPAILKIENRQQYIEALNKADGGDIRLFVRIVAQSLLETERLVLSEINQNKPQ